MKRSSGCYSKYIEVGQPDVRFKEMFEEIQPINLDA
jgi:hypothetical protein